MSNDIKPLRRLWNPNRYLTTFVPYPSSTPGCIGDEIVSCYLPIATLKIVIDMVPITYLTEDLTKVWFFSEYPTITFQATVWTQNIQITIDNVPACTNQLNDSTATPLQPSTMLRSCCVLRLHSDRQTHASSSPFPTVYHLLVFTWRPINIAVCPTLDRPTLISRNYQSSIPEFVTLLFGNVPSLALSLVAFTVSERKESRLYGGIKMFFK